jgi:hypothetical protein
MALLDKVAEKVAGAVGWLLIREIRSLRQTIEKGIDSQREIAGFHPLFSAPPSAIDQQIADEQAQPAIDREIAQLAAEPDFLRLEMLEMLARDHQIVVTAETDLIALGKARGWLDESGQITMLPQNYPS